MLSAETQTLVAPSILSVIEKVDSGQFDRVLSVLEDDPALGIFVPAYARPDGEVVPLPRGHYQEEIGQKVTITDQRESESIAVGWTSDEDTGNLVCRKCCMPHRTIVLTSTGVLLCRRSSECDCIVADQLAAAPELTPEAVQPRVSEFLQSGLMRQCATHGLGILLVHGHSRNSEFTYLPKGVVSVVEDGMTHFRPREDLDASFVPNAWRFENGSREPVGGFSVVKKY